MFLITLLIADILFLGFGTLFLYESIREKEPRAPKVGLSGVWLPDLPWPGVFSSILTT